VPVTTHDKIDFADVTKARTLIFEDYLDYLEGPKRTYKCPYKKEIGRFDTEAEEPLLHDWLSFVFNMLLTLQITFYLC
jgi:hypothetical protein